MTAPAPPPLLLRRLLWRPLVFVVAVVLALVLLPIWLVSSALVSMNIRAVARPLRLFCFAYVYALVEVAGLAAATVQWLLASAGTRLHTERGQRRNYALLGSCLTVMLTAGEHFFRLEIESEASSTPSPQGPLIMISRHAGPGDSFLLVHRLILGFDRRPRLVLKEALQWDPLLDVILNRSPNVFTTPGEPTAHVVERIARTAASLRSGDALLIFPEGGNFTEYRRSQVIRRLHDSGHTAAARRAEDLERLLAPRVTGLHAALVAQPAAAVAVVAHTGLDELNTVPQLWEAVPVRKTLVVSWQYFDAASVPRDPVELHDWLGYQWQLMDTWVAVESARLGARG